MRHRIGGSKLHRPTDERLALYRNLVTAFLSHEKIVTTEAKAKAVKGIAERIITLGKKGSLSHRRQALSVVYDEAVVQKVFGDLKDRYVSRPGGYARIVKLGPRAGDAALMVQLELVT